MGHPLLDIGLSLAEKVDWADVAEAARFYYTNAGTTINLYPALLIGALLTLLAVPLLGSLPSIDFFGSPYAAPASSYGAPEPSYGAPDPGYGVPARQWNEGYRSFKDEAAEDLDAIYDTGTGNEDTDYHRAARSAEPFPALPLAETLSQKLQLLQ